MIKEFNNVKEIKQYYDKESNTYEFKEDGEHIDLVVFNFDLNIKANIVADDIKARDITAYNIIAWNIVAYDINASDIKANNIDSFAINASDIDARDIKARNINARVINARDIIANDIDAGNINYYAVCFSYKNIKCKSIKGIRANAKHFALDGKIEVIEDD